MTVVPFLAVALMSISATSASRSQLTYQEAAAAAKTQSQDPAVIGWAKGALAPLFEREFKPLLETCVKLVSELEPTAGRIVVILGSGEVTITVDPEGSESFSRCIADGLQKWHWPTPPTSVVYVPLELNLRPSDPAEADKEADQFIRDLTSSNKSLERTRDK
jgi:hypothetical protein